MRAEHFMYVNWDELFKQSNEELLVIIEHGGPSAVMTACRMILEARRMELSQEHSVLIYKEPGEDKFRVICETCGTALGRFASYPEAYSAGRKHEREAEDGQSKREG